LLLEHVVFVRVTHRPPRSALFPYTTLFRSAPRLLTGRAVSRPRPGAAGRRRGADRGTVRAQPGLGARDLWRPVARLRAGGAVERSEERRVGKECKSRGVRYR